MSSGHDGGRWGLQVGAGGLRWTTRIEEWLVAAPAVENREIPSSSGEATDGLVTGLLEHFGNEPGSTPAYNHDPSTAAAVAAGESGRAA
jgi:hypothetical protein